MIINTNNNSVSWKKKKKNGAEFINVTEKKNRFQIRQDWDWKQDGVKKEKKNQKN